MTQSNLNHTAFTLNLGYAAHQLQKAQQTHQQHPDEATRERAAVKIQQWQNIFEHIQTGSMAYGSRTPLSKIPAWVSLEVAAGGFATGRLLAGGELQAHEQEWLKTLKLENTTEPRLSLNQYFLTGAGLEQLQTWLANGQYEITVPEEGAFLVMAALLEHNQLEIAADLIKTISPFLAQLRFYPKPLPLPRPPSTQVCLQTVGEVVENLGKIRPKQHMLAQQEALLVWLPFYDRIVGLMLATMQNDWPCQIYPHNWTERASALLLEYKKLSQQHNLCSKHSDRSDYQWQLREFMRRCVKNPSKLTGFEVGRIRYILKTYLAKRGAPHSDQQLEVRKQQLQVISQPSFHQLAQVVLARLQTKAFHRGLEDLEPVLQAITAPEAQQYRLPVGSDIPTTIQTKVERCRIDSLEKLLETGLISSGEVLAKVLPQMTSGLQAMNFAEQPTRQLYVALYQAFRKRRSLLLVNLAKQVQLEELPWVTALDTLRTPTLSQPAVAKQALVEACSLALRFFPYTMLPNKLLQELRALARTAQLELPLVDELAADIFMGAFSEKFTEAVLQAGELLEDTVYARYYAIDYPSLKIELTKPVTVAAPAPTKRKKAVKTISQTHDQKKLAILCAQRANVALHSWQPAWNGMIIEQQQILTTQNLAVLWVGLGLEQTLQTELPQLARTSLLWIYKQLQIKPSSWHSQLLIQKNTAYAWRQIVFFLSLLSETQQTSFLDFATQQLASQPTNLHKNFKPLLRGLANALTHKPLEQGHGKIFLGWTKENHLFG